MSECATCNRVFKTASACVQHCKDKGHLYIAPKAPASPVPGPSSVPTSASVPTTTTAAPSKAAATAFKVVAAPAYECKPCCLVFADQVGFDEHRRTTHTAKPAFSCVPCAMQFSSAEALSIHLRYFAIHPKCAECGSAFIDQTQLDQHVKLAHSNKFKCDPCDREIALSERQKHFRESSNHPVCFVCEDGFLDDAVFNEHLSTAHLECRCIPCRRQLRSKEDLQRHYLTSPMHPHCALCEVGFVDDAACDAHMQINHPRQPSKLPSPPPSAEPVAEAVPSSSLETQLSTQSSPLAQRPPLGSIVVPIPTVLNERSQLDDDSYETVEASSHVQRAVSEPTLPTASSMGPSSVQGAVPYMSRSPTISERSLDDVMRRHTFIRHADSESTASLRSVSTSPTGSYLRSPSPAFPQPQLARPPQTLVPELVTHRNERTESVIGERFARVRTPSLRTPSALSRSEREEQQTSHTSSRAMDMPIRRSMAPSLSSRPSTPGPARTPLRTTASRPLSRVSLLSSNPIPSLSQKPSMTAVDPPSLSDSEGTVEGPSSPPRAKAAVRRQAKAAAGTISWHCRSCMQEPCDAPTATACGHIFCTACIIKELSKTGACPACDKLILLRLHVEAA
ncbi:hypothetical protein C8Q79DRAFT_963419 [Trametes meyenii]|nr:hypothetical protein C8Q79DRAFT_963419 [Trametes meyenii]